MTVCILTHSSLSLAYAALGLNLWYEKMVPVLFAVYDPVRHFDPYGHDGQPDPSGKTFVRKNLSPVSTGNLCDPDGFLCGFSMGAHTASDFRDRQEISSEEGQYLRPSATIWDQSISWDLYCRYCIGVGAPLCIWYVWHSIAIWYFPAL